MDDFDPFLQIIHVSDLHLVSTQFTQQPLLRTLRRILQHVPGLHEAIEDGMAPHDPTALSAFEDFVRKIVADDPEWRARQNWIVDTGDLTTFGDDPSLKEGQDFLGAIQAAATVGGSPGTLHSIHGNHDAWPANFPALEGDAQIGAHRARLRATWYPKRWPDAPLRCPIPGGGGREVQLYAINTVLHDRLRNTVALGEVQEDCYWQHGRPQPLPDVQMTELAKLIDTHGGQAARHMRILATHHPVHFPPPVPAMRWKMVLGNDTHVARLLDSPTPGQLAPRVHLVMSGHTHALFPDHGTLPQTAQLCTHQHLGLHQAQLVVGSLCQLDFFGKRGGTPQQAEVLRFHASPTRSEILVQRLLASRAPGPNGTAIGPYEFVQTSGGAVEEEIEFSV